MTTATPADLTRPESITAEEAFFKISDAQNGIVRRFLRSKKNIEYQIDFDDLVQGCICHWIDKKYLQRYNPKITTIDYFLYVGIRNYAYSYVTKKRIKTISENIILAKSDDEEQSLVDLVGYDVVDYMSTLMSEEVLSLVDTAERGKEVEIPEKGTGRLSSRNVFDLWLKGYSMTEIHRVFNITATRVSQIVREVLAFLKHYLGVEQVEKVAA